MTLTASPPPPLHGGGVFAAARRLGLSVDDILDFSANMNPLGPPPGLRRAMLESLDRAVHYPDPECFELRQALAQRLGLAPECVLVGNGSTELIYLLARALAPSRALVVTPAFAEYRRALELAGATVADHPTSEAAGYALARPLEPAQAQAELAILANPASPSGAGLEPEALLALVEPFMQAGGWVVVDEAFVDFAPGLALHSHLGRYTRLILLRSFTKFYAIPGLRLGCLLAAPEMIARLERVKEPWSVGSPAQAAGLACLGAGDYDRCSVELMDRERAFLSQGLAALEGLAVFPSRANYLLVRLDRPGWSAARLRAALEPAGILIRDASNFAGLDQRHVRLAVRGREDNQKLLAALAGVLAAGEGA